MIVLARSIVACGICWIFIEFRTLALKGTSLIYYSVQYSDWVKIEFKIFRIAKWSFLVYRGLIWFSEISCRPYKKEKKYGGKRNQKKYINWLTWTNWNLSRSLQQIPLSTIYYVSFHFHATTLRTREGVYFNRSLPTSIQLIVDKRRNEPTCCSFEASPQGTARLLGPQIEQFGCTGLLVYLINYRFEV